MLAVVGVSFTIELYDQPTSKRVRKLGGYDLFLRLERRERLDF